MRRREFIRVVGGVAAAWPFAARAQTKVRQIGILMPLAQGDPDGKAQIAAFHVGLQKLGWTERRNLKTEIRWTGGNADQLPIVAKELVDLRPDVILARSTPAVKVLLGLTKSIPIVFVSVSDPLGDGLVKSFSRPGGNVTGFTNVEASMSGKWVELLKECMPRISQVAMIFNPNTAPGGGNYFLPTFEKAASSIGLKRVSAPVKDVSDIEPTISSLAREPNSGLIVMSDVFFTIHSNLIVQLVEKYRLPTVYSFRFYVTNGGLIAYGTDITDLYRRASQYVDRILNGDNPGELPVQNPTKFELVINLKTAKTLGLTVPPTLLARADEVIE
jgi:putative tryptophan/tyrosine transport system substrate-binding protein